MRFNDKHKKIEYTVLLSCSVGGESHWSGTFLLQLLGDILDSWTVSLSSSTEDPRLEQEGRRTEETPSPLLFMMPRDKNCQQCAILFAAIGHNIYLHAVFIFATKCTNLAHIDNLSETEGELSVEW